MAQVGGKSDDEVAWDRLNPVGKSFPKTCEWAIRGKSDAELMQYINLRMPRHTYLEMIKYSSNQLADMAVYYKAEYRGALLDNDAKLVDDALTEDYMCDFGSRWKAELAAERTERKRGVKRGHKKIGDITKSYQRDGNKNDILLPDYLVSEIYII